MSMFKNVKVYLGLGPDEEYEDRYLGDPAPAEPVGNDDYADAVEPAVSRTGPSSTRQAAARAEQRAAAQARTNTQPSAVGAVRPLRSVPMDDPAPGDTSDSDEVVVRRLDESTVTPRAIQHTKPKSVSPQSFGDAKVLADEFKRSVPVVMNLQDLDRDLSRRLIDFASGVCYALGGAMEKLAPGVFLLTPRGVEVSGDDRRRLEERGFA